MLDKRTTISVSNFWPTPVWHVQLEDFKTHPTRVNYNDDLYSFIKGLKEKNKSVKKSNIGGWQSDLLDQEKEVKPLCDEILEILKHLPLKITKAQIMNMWANVNNKYDWNRIHSHPESSLSGVYYVKLPQESGKIIFRDPRPGALMNCLINERYDHGELKWVGAKETSLLLFPSFLDHFVEPSMSDDERVSISFNITAY